MRWIVPILFAAMVVPSTAQAQQKSVTIAARACPSYEAITANRARNDIQESLRDLGADTPYSSSDAVDPDVEGRSQPLCRPLPNWRLTLGTGYRTRAVSGSWGSLSIVTSPYSTSVVTEDSIPLLNTAGASTGRQIEGATRVTLNSDQVNQAARHNLWLQGGTPPCARRSCRCTRRSTGSARVERELAARV